MEIKTLEVTMISAKDLKKVKFFSRMSVYAVATILGADPADSRRTVPDREGGRCPNWGTVVRFVIRSLDPNLALHIVLRSEGFLRDHVVGEVFVPVTELLESGSGDEEKLVSYQVCRPSGRPKGVLNLSYKVVERNGSPNIPAKNPVQQHVKKDEPVTAYPVVSPYPPPSGPYQGGVQYGAPQGYHPYPPPAYPYPIAQPAYGYGAPPSQVGYGYGSAPAPAPAPKKSRFGAGLGMGLLGGALGGMVLGDMMTDNMAYDAGYDAGFDDGAGF